MLWITDYSIKLFNKEMAFFTDKQENLKKRKYAIFEFRGLHQNWIPSNNFFPISNLTSNKKWSVESFDSNIYDNLTLIFRLEI